MYYELRTDEQGVVSLPATIGGGPDGILKIEEYVKDKSRVLEWGSGGSTLHFSKMVDNYVSIEHNQEWYDKVSAHISDNVEFHYVPYHEYKSDDELDKHAADLLWGAGDTTLEDGITCWRNRDGYDWHCGIDYIKKPLDLSYRNYDVIIVDGRCRAMCTYITKYLLKDDGYLLFDDFPPRIYYHGILKYYKIIDVVYTEGGALAVLVKRKKVIDIDQVKKLSDETYLEFTTATGRIR